jgi:hypothetical protein
MRHGLSFSDWLSAHRVVAEEASNCMSNEDATYVLPTRKLRASLRDPGRPLWPELLDYTALLIGKALQAGPNTRSALEGPISIKLNGE